MRGWLPNGLNVGQRNVSVLFSDANKTLIYDDVSMLCFPHSTTLHGVLFGADIFVRALQGKL